MPDTSSELLTLTRNLVSAYLEHNKVSAGQLSGLIIATHDSLAKLGALPSEPPTPEIVGAVSLRKSIASPEHIISMIDGKPYRTLKKHIGKNGMTPSEYRSRYKLPADYPMVAPAYSAERSAMAKRIGLGRKPVELAAPAPPPSRRKLKIASPKID